MNHQHTLNKLEERIANLEAGVRQIIAKDKSSMYARCPDCDYPYECCVTKTCTTVPMSLIGELAMAVLKEK